MKARLPKGMGGGPQNMQSMIKQAQQMQQQMEEKQEELKSKEFSAASGGGAVSIKMNGAKEVLELTLKPEVVDPEDIEMLQDLVISAVNECIHTIDAVSASEMEQITGGLNVPGMF